MNIDAQPILSLSTQGEATLIANNLYANQLYYNNDDGDLVIQHYRGLVTIRSGSLSAALTVGTLGSDTTLLTVDAASVSSITAGRVAADAVAASTLSATLLVLQPTAAPGVGIFVDAAQQLSSLDAFGSLTAYAPARSKGDISTCDGSTQVALAVGAQSAVLLADAAAPTGLRWAQQVLPEGQLATRSAMLMSSCQAYQAAVQLDASVLGGTYLLQVGADVADYGRGDSVGLRVTSDGMPIFERMLFTPKVRDFQRQTLEFVQVLALGTHTASVDYMAANGGSVALQNVSISCCRLA
jgi:hypothetical protein